MLDYKQATCKMANQWHKKMETPESGKEMLLHRVSIKVYTFKPQQINNLRTKENILIYQGIPYFSKISYVISFYCN